jgi:flagellar protein FliO/FliZ
VFELIVRIGFSLLVVVGLMWMLAKLARRPLAARGSALTVLARQQLSRAASITVVRVGDRALVLGITDGQVTLLGETDPAALTRTEEARRTTVELPPADAASPVPAPAPAPVPAQTSAPAQVPVQVPVQAPGRLDGSLLSPRTWRQTVEFLRERTVRR